MPWFFPNLKKLELTLDCFPIWEMPYINANFTSVEELSLAFPNYRREDADDFQNVASNLRREFPNLQRLKIFALKALGLSSVMQVTDLQKIENFLLALETIEWIAFSPLDEGQSLKRVFTCERAENSVQLHYDDELQIGREMISSCLLFLSLREFEMAENAIPVEWYEAKSISCTKFPDLLVESDDGDITPFYVSSQCLRNASPVWDKLLDPDTPFSCPRIQKFNGQTSTVISFKGDSSIALRAYFDILYYRTDKVPRRLNINDLYHVAVLCDKYDLERIFNSPISMWLDGVVRYNPEFWYDLISVDREKWLSIGNTFPKICFSKDIIESTASWSIKETSAPKGGEMFIRSKIFCQRDLIERQVFI
ncbi:hypothetical protein ABW20_dc0106792 [Dactylellina cionopaga]|nr:hypothetical protein ABW20_dc0106792 [Dactylellina cionopaga]